VQHLVEPVFEEPFEVFDVVVFAVATRQVEVNLADALSRLRDALNVHVSQLVAWGNQDPQNEPAARAALKPIDDSRARDAARASGKKPPEPDVTPQTPLPATP